MKAILVEEDATFSVEEAIPVCLKKSTLLEVNFRNTLYSILNNTSVWWRCVYRYLKMNRSIFVLVLKKKRPSVLLKMAFVLHNENFKPKVRQFIQDWLNMIFPIHILQSRTRRDHNRSSDKPPFYGLLISMYNLWIINSITKLHKLASITRI